jgi:hypothetical protein
MRASNKTKADCEETGKMKISEVIKERILIGLITLLSGAIGVLLTSIYKDAAAPFIQNVLPAINNKTLLLLCLLLFLIILILGTWIAFLVFGDKTKRTLRKYEFEKIAGFYMNRITGQKVCAHCLLSKGIESPLAVNVFQSSYVWQCVISTCESRWVMKPDEIKALNLPNLSGVLT